MSVRLHGRAACEPLLRCDGRQALALSAHEAAIEGAGGGAGAESAAAICRGGVEGGDAAVECVGAEAVLGAVEAVGDVRGLGLVVTGLGDGVVCVEALEGV